MFASVSVIVLLYVSVSVSVSMSACVCVCVCVCVSVSVSVVFCISLRTLTMQEGRSGRLAWGDNAGSSRRSSHDDVDRTPHQRDGGI